AMMTQETLEIPRRYGSSGFRYGVTIVPSDDKPFDVYFLAGFPSAPKELNGLAKDSTMNPVSRTLKTPIQHLKEPTTIPMWFDPGDPVGEYSLEVFINNESKKLIRYKVIAE